MRFLDSKQMFQMNEDIAREVMGWELDCGCWYWTGPNRVGLDVMNMSQEDWDKFKRGELKDWDRESLPYFCNDLNTAWRVVKHLTERGWFFGLSGAGREPDTDPVWQARFSYWPDEEEPTIEGYSLSDSEPIAICEAALKAVRARAEYFSR